MGKRFTRFRNIHKMSNACTSSFGRYIHKIIKRMIHNVCEKFQFFIWINVFKKNGRAEKNWNLFAVTPSEKQAPLIEQTPSRISIIIQPPPISLKRGRYRKWSIVLYPEFFWKYWYIFLLQGFVQAILMSSRRHKKLNLLIEFSNSIFIKFCFKAEKNMLMSNLHSK